LHLGESGALSQSEWKGGDQEARGTAGAPSQQGRHLHFHSGGGSTTQLLMSSAHRETVSPQESRGRQPLGATGHTTTVTVLPGIRQKSRGGDQPCS
ncbi:hypothetical protein MKX01_025579, partial [Papaver californicum]